MKKNKNVSFRLYIQFRNDDGNKVYRSPTFYASKDLINEDTKLGQKFDTLVSDGDDESIFRISCDIEISGHNIIWKMQDPFDADWVRQLESVWSRMIGFPLPEWNDWDEIESLDEAYENE